MQPDPWTHCHYCGAPLVEFHDHQRPRQRCSRCGQILYRNPVPAAGCVVVQHGAVLLVQRRRPPFPGHWHFPSGFVEYDEDIEAAAVRETYEETGLVVEPRSIFGAYSYFDDPRKNGIIILFRAEVVGGTLRPGDDAAAADFFAPDRLPQPLCFAAHIRALRDWIERG